MKTIYLRMTDSMAEQIHNEAKRRGLTKSGFMRDILFSKLEKKEEIKN